MKNLIKVAFVFALAVITLASCSKDQKCVNWLEGEWNITGFKLNAVDMIALANLTGGSFSGTMTFDKYSVKKDEMGNSTVILNTTSLLGNSNDTIVGNYKILDDCETFSAKETGATTWENGTIVDPSKKKMIINYVQNTDTLTFTIEK